MENMSVQGASLQEAAQSKAEFKDIQERISKQIQAHAESIKRLEVLRDRLTPEVFDFFEAVEKLEYPDRRIIER